MEYFDHHYAMRLLSRLDKITQDARPNWGKMTGQDLFQHIGDMLRYSMGQLGDLPDKSNFLTRGIIKTLLLNRMIPIIKNVRGPAFDHRNQVPENLETLRILLERYLALVQAGEFCPKPHPVFGPLTVDDWAKLHVIHFNHHLRQFGV